MKLIHILGILVLMVAGTWLLVNTVLPEPRPQNPTEQVAFGLKYNLPRLTADGYASLIRQEPENPAYHFGYIKQQQLLKVDLNRLAGQYIQEARRLPSGAIANAKHLAAGLCQAASGEHFQALFNYNKVSNSQLPYLSYAMGVSYQSLRRYRRAEAYFDQELQLENGFQEGTAQQLYQLYALTKQEEKRFKLVADANIRKFLPPEEVRLAAFQQANLALYLESIFKTLKRQFNLTGFLAALGVMLVWLLYLQKLDLFAPAQAHQVIIVLGLGMIMSFGVFVLSDGRQILFGLEDAVHGDSFLYWVLDVGVAEEGVKLLPLLVVMLCTQWIQEPFDYILFASISALGFAFIENGLYYDGVHLNIIHARAMTAVVGHMFHSSLVAYGFVLCRYRFPDIPMAVAGLITFILASLSHGLYDFLLGKGVFVEALGKEVYPAFVVFFLFIILLWANFINNTINHSPFFSLQKRFKPQKLMHYLVIALTGVLVFEYLTVGLHYGAEVANRSLLKASFNGSFMILVLAFGLSRIELNKGKWLPLSWQAILPYRRTAEGRIERAADRQELMGSEVLLSAYAYNTDLKSLFPHEKKAQIIHIHQLHSPQASLEMELWWELEMAEPLSWEEGLQDRILIQFKSKDEFMRKQKSLALVLAIPEGMNMSTEKQKRSDFIFKGWIRITQAQSS